MSRIDLHLHTTHSDGSLQPSEVLALAKKANVTALAITDHDITSGISEAMICTLTGLAVSITGLYPAYYFRRRVRRETELLADKFSY